MWKLLLAAIHTTELRFMGLGINLVKRSHLPETLFPIRHDTVFITRCFLFWRQIRNNASLNWSWNFNILNLLNNGPDGANRLRNLLWGPISSRNLLELLLNLFLVIYNLLLKLRVLVLIRRGLASLLIVCGFYFVAIFLSKSDCSFKRIVSLLVFNHLTIHI